MHAKILLATCAAAALAAGAAQAQAPKVSAPVTACSSLANTPPEGGGRIVSAVDVPAGPFAIPGPGGTTRNVSVAAACRVNAVLTPTSDSEIKVEVWLPANWNGRLLGVGNGGWAGSVQVGELAARSAEGYVAVSTDTGHTGGSGSFALGHPEKLIDFGTRGIHLMTVNAKRLARAYYGTPASYAYFNACSGGGRQAMTFAQRFPGDYDGIVAGAPAANWARLTASGIWIEQASLDGADKPRLGPAQYSLLRAGAMAQCDALDGIKDNEIADPRRCNFKPERLACKAGAVSDACLTTEQLAIVRHIYAPSRNSKTGAFLFPAPLPGSELGWAQTAGTPVSMGIDNYKYAIKGDADWDFRKLDWGGDVEAAEKMQLEHVIATNPDLSRFKARGGKLIQYHGWADHLIVPEDSLNYYESVVAEQGSLSATQDFYRLFLVPAMSHCSGAYTLPLQSAIEAWVETKAAPASLEGKRMSAQTTFGVPSPPPATPITVIGARPICAYPAVARYDGKGDINAAASFACVAGPRGSRVGNRPAKLGGRVSAG